MTPAINILKKSKVEFYIHEYEHDPNHSSFGTEAAEKLGISEDRVFKTLVAMLDNKELVVAVVPVSTRLNTKALAKTLNAKRAEMADKADVERSTGYVLGGVSPLGQKKRLKTVIDAAAANFPTIFISAGRRGLEIELAAEHLRALVGGTLADISG